jgi:UDP-3-O-[3-hydroxymyristoyl] glucosamine N-acyltransferase
LIHSGTSIGCDGFGFVTHEGIHEKIPQTGNVEIGNDVEIGSNCAIDRATIGTTSIGDMTKMDNLVHIAHNVKVGKGCLITAGFAIAGSSEIGEFCTFAGQVGVAPHVKIGPNSIFAAKSGVTKSLKGGKVYAGYPAREIKEHNKRDALLNEIGRLRKKLDQLAQDRVEK